MAAARPRSIDGGHPGGPGWAGHPPADDTVFRPPGAPRSLPARGGSWTRDLPPDSGMPTPLRSAGTQAPRPDLHVVRAVGQVRPEPIQPEVVDAGPDWARILTRSLALVAVGLCAGILLSRPWAPREDAPRPTAESSVGVPAASADPTGR